MVGVVCLSCKPECSSLTLLRFWSCTQPVYYPCLHAFLLLALSGPKNQISISSNLNSDVIFPPNIAQCLPRGHGITSHSQNILCHYPQFESHPTFLATIHYAYPPWHSLCHEHTSYCTSISLTYDLSQLFMVFLNSSDDKALGNASFCASEHIKIPIFH